MKKKLLIGLSVFAVLTLSGLLYLNSQLEFLLTKHLPEIRTQLSGAVGAPIKLDKVSASLFPSPQISIHEFYVLHKDNTPSKLGIKQVTLKLAVLPLLSKELKVTTLLLESPHVELEKNEAGVSIVGLPLGKNKEHSPPKSENKDAPAKGNPSDAPLPFTVSIEGISISNGEVRWRDNQSNLAVSLSELAVTAGIELEGTKVNIPTLKASFRINDKESLHVRISKASLDKNSLEVSIPEASVEHSAGSIGMSANIKQGGKDGTVSVSSRALDLKKLLSTAQTFQPALPPLQPSGEMGFTITSTIKTGAPELSGKILLRGVGVLPSKELEISDLGGEITLAGPVDRLALRTEALALKYNKAPIALSGVFIAGPKQFKVKKLDVSAFKGTASVVSDVALGEPLTIAASPKLSDISIEAVLSAVKPSLAGMLRGNLTLAEGSFSNLRSNDPMNSVSGQAKILMKEGTLKDFNLAQQVLEGVQGLPFLASSLRSKVPPEFEAIVSSPNTGIQEFRSEATVTGGTITFSELYLESDIFSVTSTGTYKTSGKLHLPAIIKFSPPFSRAITERVIELRALLDSSGRLELPVVVHGTVPNVIVAPDVSVIVKKAAVGTVRQAITGSLKGGKDIKKAIGGVLGF